jgi:hypothetical protein
MTLSHEHVGLKISVNIKTYVLSRAKLLCTLCHEIPCMIISELSTSLNLYIIYTLISLIFPFSNLKHSGICYFGPLYNTIHVSHFVAVQNNYFSIQFPNQSAPNFLVHDCLAKIVCVVSTINLVLRPPQNPLLNFCV